VKKTGNWSEEGQLKGDIDSKDFGQSVSISGNHIVVGDGRDSSSRGAAYVFVWDGEEWTREAYIPSPSPDNGWFGVSVSILGVRMIIGARNQDIDGVNGTGAAYVFVKNETANSWDLEVTLTADTPEVNTYFGKSVSISGDIIAVFRDTTNGEVYVYKREDAEWVKQTVLIGHHENSYFGFEVSVSSDYIIVSAILEISGGSGFNNCTDENPIESGAAYVYETTSWSPIACIKSLDPQEYEEFGTSVDVYDGTFVIGTAFDQAFVYESLVSTTGTTGASGTTGNSLIVDHF
jgi:hypothetical protein